MYHDPGRPTAVLGTPRFNDASTPHKLEAGRRFYLFYYLFIYLFLCFLLFSSVAHC